MDVEADKRRRSWDGAAIPRTTDREEMRTPWRRGGDGHRVAEIKAAPLPRHNGNGDEVHIARGVEDTHSLTHCICLTFRTHRSMLCVGLTRTILTMTQRPGLESISSLGALTDLEEVGLGDSEPRRSEIRARAGRILFTTCLVLTCFTNCRSKNKKIGIEIRFRRYDDKKPKFVSVQNNFIGCWTDIFLFKIFNT